MGLSAPTIAMTTMSAIMTFAISTTVVVAVCMASRSLVSAWLVTIIVVLITMLWTVMMVTSVVRAMWWRWWRTSNVEEFIAPICWRHIYIYHNLLRLAIKRHIRVIRHSRAECHHRKHKA